MRLIDKSNNAKEYVLEASRKLNFLIAPSIGLLISLAFRAKEFTVVDAQMSNIINVSGVLAGFLFATHGIMLSFPDDKKFIILLKQYGIFNNIYRNIFYGEMMLIGSLFLGLASSYITHIKILTIFMFSTGLMYAVASSIYLYKISKRVGK